MTDTNSKGPGILGALPLVGGIFNAISQGAQNRKNRNFQREMYSRQRADALADWERQNAYNAPINQRKRLEEAGLNPAMMYGGAGSGAAGQAAPTRGSQVSGQGGQAAQFQGGISDYIGMQMLAPQKDNVQAAAQLTRQQRLTEIVKGINIAADTDNKKLENTLTADFYKYKVEAQKADIQNVKARTWEILRNDRRAEAQLVLQKVDRNLSTRRLVNETISTLIGASKSKQEIENLKAAKKLITAQAGIAKAEAKLAEEGVFRGDAIYYRQLIDLISAVKSMAPQAATDYIEKWKKDPLFMYKEMYKAGKQKFKEKWNQFRK